MAIPSNRAKTAASLAALCLLTQALAVTAAANPLAPSWSGVYFGLHAGGDWADLDAAALGNFSDVSAVGGGHLGYNVGLGRFVAGIEADAGYAKSNFALSNTGASGDFETNWRGTVRGRFGLTFGLALAYVTAGYAWSEATLTDATAAGAHSTASTTVDGVVYGAGVESYVLPGLSVRLEALRFDYGSQELSFGSGSSALQDLDLDDTVVRAGVTVHLN